MSASPLSMPQVGPAGLTAQQLQDHLWSSKRESVGRIRLGSSVSGGRVCLPSVSTKQNGWTAPGQYLVRTLCDTLVFMVAEDGSVDSRGPQHRVTGVIIHECGLLAPSSYTLSACADQYGVVRVVFGEHVCEFAGLPCVDPFCMDLEGVKTPSSPGSPSD